MLNIKDLFDTTCSLLITNRLQYNNKHYGPTQLVGLIFNYMNNLPTHANIYL